MTNKTIQTNLKGLSITFGDDGVWINFYDCIGKKHGSVNLSATEHQGIAYEALKSWAVNTLKELENE